MSLQSPWLAELVRSRPLKRLTQYLETDVVIIGAGIAGSATAAFSLLETPYRIVVLEAGRVGHGATGRNAGQMLTDFERPIAELISDFGFDVVKAGLEKVEGAWELVKELQETFHLQTPIIHAPGYDGFAAPEPFLEALENLFVKREMGLPWSQVRVVQGTDCSRVPEQYADLWVFDTQDSILTDLETEDLGYFALLPTKIACTNSAQLSEELIQALLNRYHQRFFVYEESPVSEIWLERDAIYLKSGEYTVKAKQVVLCTNGFERFKIFHHQQIDVNGQVHRDIRGLSSYMQAYLVPAYNPVKALSYYTASQRSSDEDDPSAAEAFTYLTRRPFKPKGERSEGLVCVGGPETAFPEDEVYDFDWPLPERIRAEFDSFLKGSPLGAHADAHHPTFEWHGLMGYTNGRVRCVGPEPCYANLLYNLGCNGIGIMTSIYGGKRIAGLLIGTDDGAHLFDPKMHLCSIEKKKSTEG
jgi:glycine/D-amino acid oxidase-like deaminating enzyme